jgi:AbrB family looped-hinge helix DNA binding protein
MKATMTSKGQITIPAKIRRKLNLKPGNILEFDENSSFLKAVRVFDPGQMYGIIGCCKSAISSEQTANEWLDQTRGKVKLPKDRNANRR